MMVISFAETAGALMAGRKTCTRRQWKVRWAMQFRAGDIVQAYDRSPRHGGHRIALLKLVADPVYTADLPEDDYAAEGLDYLEERGQLVFGMNPRALWDLWQYERRPQWVIRFRVLEPAEVGLL